jgi:SAM-dependent methyltransferase
MIKAVPADGVRRYRVPPPVGARLMSARETRWQCAGKVAREAWRLPGHRTPAASLDEYERRWAAQRRQGRWMRAQSMDDAVGLSSFGDATLAAMIDGSGYRVAAADYFRWRRDKLVQVFTRHYPLDTPIAEVGCGVGKNLLALASGGYCNLCGGDPAPSALACLTELAARFGLHIPAFRCDLLAPDAVIAERLRGRVVFTNHVLEQLPRHLSRAIDTIANAEPLEVIHLEPAGDLLRPWASLTDLATWVHLRARDYQRGLIGQLAKLEASGRLRLLEVAPMAYGPRLWNPPTLVRWAPG